MPDVIENTISAIANIRYLSHDELSFNQTVGGFLSLSVGEERYNRVGLYRMFPYDHPSQFILVKDTVDENKEIGIISDINELNGSNLSLCQKELDKRYFIPIIKKITKFKERGGTGHFTVETEQGDVSFVTWDLVYNIVLIGAHNIYITDVYGNRFLIPDIEALDKKSRQYIQMYI